MNIFKEISLGGVSKDDLLHRLTSSGIQFNTYAKILFDHPDFVSDGPIEILKLVKIQPAVLGMQNPYSMENLIQAASSLNLKTCPLSLAAFLRLEFMDQPAGPYLTIASNRPSNDETYPTGFYIRNDQNSLWLRGYRAIGECNHPMDNEFIFLKD